MRLTPRSSLIVTCLLASLLGNPDLRADPLAGQDIEITTELDNGPSQSATVVDNSNGSQIDASSLNFSWAIPGEYFSFGFLSNGLDSFSLLLSGNNHFNSTDVLDISFTLPSGMTFDPSETALTQAYFGASVNVDGDILSLQLTNLDTISNTIDNVNTPVEAVSRVQVPDASSTAGLLAAASVLMLGLAEWSNQRRRVLAAR